MVTIEEYSDEDAATNCYQYGSFEFLQEVLSDLISECSGLNFGTLANY